MSRIKEPSIEELQLRIDELEKSHNTYSEVIDTFTNGYVMDLISSNIKTIKIYQDEQLSQIISHQTY